MRWTPMKIDERAKEILEAEGDSIKLVLKLTRPTFYKGRNRTEIVFGSVRLQGGGVFAALKPGTHYMTPLKTLPYPVSMNVEDVTFEKQVLTDDWIPFEQVLSRKHSKSVWRNVTEEEHIKDAVTDGKVKVRRMASTPFKNHSKHIRDAFDEKRDGKWTHEGKQRNMVIELSYNKEEDDLQAWFRTTSKYGHGEHYMLISPTTAVLINKN